MMKMILNGQARAPDLISSIPNQIENVIHSMIESGFRVAGKERSMVMTFWSQGYFRLTLELIALMDGVIGSGRG